MSPATLETLNLIYGSDSMSDLDVEICNFITDYYHLIQPEKLYQDLPEGYYNTWASIVSQAKEDYESKIYQRPSFQSEFNQILASRGSVSSLVGEMRFQVLIS